MGLVELLLWLPFAALAMGMATWLLVSRDRDAVTSPSAPLPVLPALLALLWVVVSPLPGLALGSLGWTLLISGAEDLVTVDPARDQGAVVWSAIGLAVTWWIVPGVATLGWLALSARRSVPVALGFAGVTWLGATVGAVVGWMLALPTLPPLPDAIQVSISIAALAAARRQAMLGLGAAGACLGVGVVAASSRDGLRGTLWATLALPCLALTVGAFTTPPDVVSQILMAFPVVACWLLSLGIGAVVQLSGAWPDPSSRATTET
jgi:hypothetical protein